MAQPIFKGIATALITPTNEKGVDYDRLDHLIDWQIEQGIHGLVVTGTTGEASTMTDAEHKAVIRHAVRRVNGRVPVIAGTGSNETAYACELSAYASAEGADACLVVAPYYNKATQKGLVGFYRTIADSSTVPVILYNVPSRTSINIDPPTYAELMDHPRIVAIKEANSDMSQLVETMALCGDRLAVYAGNDDQIVPVLAMGGSGCISVMSNVLPRETIAIYDRFAQGDIAGARALQCKYHAFITALFSEVNPIPVKAAMADLGYCENFLRLPLTPMEEDHHAILREEMRKVGLDV